MRKYIIVGTILMAVLVAVDEMESFFRSRQDTRKLSRAASTAAIPPVALPQLAFKSESQMKIAGATPLDVAKNFLEAHRAEWGLQPYHDFRPVEFSNPLGTKVKFSVYQSGVPIVDMGIQIEIGRDLSVKGVQNNYRPLAKADLSLRNLSAQQLMDRNQGRFELDGPTSSLSPVLFARPGKAEPEVAYLIPVRDRRKNSASVQVLFRASDGQVLGKSFDRVEFAE